MLCTFACVSAAVRVWQETRQACHVLGTLCGLQIAHHRGWQGADGLLYGRPPIRANHADRSQIEVAYDILLMESMKRRLSGEADVARSVRFADVPQPKKKQVDFQLPSHVMVGRTLL